MFFCFGFFLRTFFFSQKIQFADDEDENVEDEKKSEKSLELNDLQIKNFEDNDDLSDPKRIEMQKSIERAKLRRAEEEKRLIEKTKARCAEKLRLLDMKKGGSDSESSVSKKKKTF